MNKIYLTGHSLVRLLAGKSIIEEDETEIIPPTKEHFVMALSDAVNCAEGHEDYEYRQCGGCIHKGKESPSPCDSCDQAQPTNLEHE